LSSFEERKTMKNSRSRGDIKTKPDEIQRPVLRIIVTDYRSLKAFQSVIRMLLSIGFFERRDNRYFAGTISSQ